MSAAATTVGPLVTENGNVNQVKSLDANRYATKKTIAQGMLDIALLTANASQLKYILQVGKQHEFYTLMLTLICLSIGLQILSGLLSLSLNLMLDRKMEDSRNGYAIEWIGRVRVALSFIVFLDNILIAAFDPMGLSSLMLFDTTSEIAIVGVLFIIVGGLDINRRRDQWAANIINDIILIGIFVVSLTNIVISGFGMEFSNKPREILTGANFALRRGIDMNTEIIPIISESLGLSKCSSEEILQGLMFIFVGSSININKERDQHKANIWCNIVLAAMVLTVVINIIISAFGIN